MHDYDVIVRIPIRARDMDEAYVEASNLEQDITDLLDVTANATVECTGPSEE